MLPCIAVEFILNATRRYPASVQRVFVSFWVVEKWHRPNTCQDDEAFVRSIEQCLKECDVMWDDY